MVLCLGLLSIVHSISFLNRMTLRSVLAAWGATLDILVRNSELVFSFVAQGLNTVTAVEGLSDLFVCLHESLEFCVQLSVLPSKDIAVVFKSFNLGSHVIIATAQ